MSEERDDLLETIAQEIERESFLDLAGMGARKKRDREDAALRRKATRDAREAAANAVRYMKTSRRGDALEALRRISKAKECEHIMLLMDAWPLAWKGWLNIYVTVNANSNSIPPETSYRIELTTNGRAALGRTIVNAGVA